MENNISLTKRYILCEELIAEMVKTRKIDGLVTRAFIDEYLQLCKERGIENCIPDNSISKIVKKHGFEIVDKKISGIKWRIFKRK